MLTGKAEWGKVVGQRSIRFQRIINENAPIAGESWGYASGGLLKRTSNANPMDRDQPQHHPNNRLFLDVHFWKRLQGLVRGFVLISEWIAQIGKWTQSIYNHEIRHTKQPNFDVCSWLLPIAAVILSRFVDDGKNAASRALDSPIFLGLLFLSKFLFHAAFEISLMFEAILKAEFNDATELLSKMSRAAIPCRTCDELLRIWNLPSPGGFQRRVSRRGKK